MSVRLLSYFFIIVFSTMPFTRSSAQIGLCPPNLDFEQGDFANWVCQAGIVDPGGNLILNPTPPIPGQHTIITAATAGQDPWGFFPENCPNGSGYSVRLGNSGGNHQAESISYTYNIPSTLTVFSMMFHYAVVLQDPNHTPTQQPRFRARITDVSTGLPIPCVDFDFIASASLPGFLPSPLGGGVVYKDWTPITINLNAYIGKTIRLEFITNDCVYTAHFGYAYIDVNTTCNGAIAGTTICPGDPSITLTAPFGFQSYEWWDNGFSTLLSTSQTLFLSPPPAAGTIFPVIVNPYPGFGCKDTLYATLTVGISPVADAGPDIDICRSQQVQIGSPPNPIYNYLWTPASQVTNPTISNPLAWTITPNPEEFIVRATDILTGCSAFDTMYLTARQVDTALVLTGKNSYCVGDAAAGTLSVHNVLSAVQWYNGNTPIAGATGFSYQPTVSGNYWAQVQQLGCTDSTTTIIFNVNPIPVSFAGPDASICTNNQTIQLGAPPNPAYSYSWTPAAQVSNAAIADPVAWAIGATTTEFIVHTTDPVTGCNSYDTTYITGRVVDTAVTLNGKSDFCNGDAAAGTLSVNGAITTVQWFDGTTLIPGATGISYQPSVTGNYWAQLQQFGCTDSTLTIPFAIHAIPVPSFTASSDTGCITNHSFVFTNGTTVGDGSSLSYLWRFSDGSVQTITDATKTFLSVGNYTVKLITSSSFGCKDSTGTTTVHVLPNGAADFKWDSICTNRPVTFYNLSNEKGSAQVNYNWNFNNGGPGSNIKNPLPVVYNTVGQSDVTLILTALGCENYPDSISKKVQVNMQKPGTTYRSITVPQGSSQFIHARDSIGNIYRWRPQVQLSKYDTRYTEFFATGNDVQYFIDISDIHTCVTTDTIIMLILKKPGFYLPTAFTPNGDGLNDVVRPYLVGMKGLKSFSVFNRWGNRIFYSVTYGQGWDGRYNGVTQNTGVYVWILEFYDENNKVRVEKGTITLIR
ncbi:MAG TPA: gliding motility-associated C-terminal domain-containing protein [Chitinophagaceae bacterium]|nr:gliding motility-associated C-terminal domain-containing protein [Chitinophagaceae bacterium]